VHVQTGGRSCVDDMEIISCCTAADTGADRPSGRAHSRKQITQFGAPSGSQLDNQVADHTGGSTCGH